MEGLEVGRRKDEEEDEDGHLREGTVWTAAAHCITAVIGSGVLALAWSVAQLGWILGPISLFAFAVITYYNSVLLADCYRSPNGSRNRNYMEAVRCYLGKRDLTVCIILQYVILWGAMISYTITCATSMISIMRLNCFHKHGRDATCGASGNVSMIVYGVVEIILSQLPNLAKITWLSVMAAVMSFGYSFLSLCLCLVQWVSHGETRGTLMGNMGADDGVSSVLKTWGAFQALGNIAFAYTFAMVLLEIQDTLKSPPAENITMRKANLYGIGTTTLFYVSLGCVGYAAYGNNAPGNLLTGIYEPFWLVDIAHVAIIIHLVGAYQVFAQPIFAVAEKKIDSMWPDAKFMQNDHLVQVTGGHTLNINYSKILLRSAFVILTTLISMLLPFFNAIMGLLGAMTFCSLTVYFPVKLHIVQAKVERGSLKWFLLVGLSSFCFLVSLVAAIGSFAGMIDSLKSAKLFHIKY